MGIGRRAAAEQHERLIARVDEMVRRARRDDDAVARTDVCFRVAERHPPRAGREEVDLLRPAGGKWRSVRAPGATVASASDWFAALPLGIPASSRISDPSSVTKGSRCSRRTRSIRRQGSRTARRQPSGRRYAGAVVGEPPGLAREVSPAGGRRRPRAAHAAVAAGALRASPFPSLAGLAGLGLLRARRPARRPRARLLELQRGRVRAHRAAAAQGATCTATWSPLSRRGSSSPARASCRSSDSLHFLRAGARARAGRDRAAGRAAVWRLTANRPATAAAVPLALLTPWAVHEHGALTPELLVAPLLLGAVLLGTSRAGRRSRACSWPSPVRQAAVPARRPGRGGAVRAAAPRRGVGGGAPSSSRRPSSWRCSAAGCGRTRWWRSSAPAAAGPA